jgi:hypothetical protein
MSLLETNRQKMAEIAQGILDGHISIIAGAREIHALFCGHVGIDEQDPDLNTFVASDSETDDLPIGDVRQYWAPDALERKDVEIARCETVYRERAIEAASNLVARFTR